MADDNDHSLKAIRIPGNRRVSDWKAARRHPETYPGQAPDFSFVLLNRRLLPLAFDADGGFYIPGKAGAAVQLDRLLDRQKLPTTWNRYPVLAYGANRNPATLHLKFQNYGYKSPGAGWICPVIKASLSGADVVASGFSGQGYFYGDLLVNSRFSRHTQIEVFVLLLDADQLRAINDSEGIRQQTYALCRLEPVEMSGTGLTVSPLGYLSRSPVLFSEALQSPVAYAAIPAGQRRITAMTATEMLDHFLTVFELRRSIAELTGLADRPGFAHALAQYLNRRWWRHFHRQDIADPVYEKVLALLRERIAAAGGRHAVRSESSGLQGVVALSEAYHPKENLRLKNRLGAAKN